MMVHDNVVLTRGSRVEWRYGSYMLLKAPLFSLFLHFELRFSERLLCCLLAPEKGKDARAGTRVSDCCLQIHDGPVVFMT